MNEVPQPEVATVSFIVPGMALGKGRPQMSTINGRPSMHAPAKTRRYENAIGYVAKQAMAGRPLLQSAVEVVLDIAVLVPASWSKKKQAAALAGAVRPTGKPDLDNTTKAIFDGINQIVWRDDAQVVGLTASKRYSDMPGVTVRVTEINIKESL